MGSGFPKKIRKDCGPQYRTQFTDYCKQAMIRENTFFQIALMEKQVSSAFNPSYNYAAERNLGNINVLLKYKYVRKLGDPQLYIQGTHQSK